MLDINLTSRSSSLRCGPVTAVAAYLGGMRPAPTSKKDTMMLRKNSNTNTINQTVDYLLLDCF